MVRRDSSNESELDRSSSSCYSDQIYDDDTASVASSGPGDEICDNGLVITDNNKYHSSIGSIAVSHSNDVHFGNKTFYQGPVTIKQFLYTNNSQILNSESAVGDNDKVFKISLGSDKAIVAGNINNSDLKCVSDNAVIKQRQEESSHSNTDKTSEQKNGTGWLQDLPRKQVMLVISLVIVLVTSLVISTAVLLTRTPISISNNIMPQFPSDGLELEETDVGVSKDNGSFTLPGKLKIIARAEWLAQPPTEPLAPLKLPVPYVIIMHTATEPCTDQPTCVFHVRHIQMYHVESRKWWDIAYNFLVGGDGFAYEGRGWKPQGAHTYGYNARSIGIALIGTFTSVLPHPRQITATKQLIEKGVELGYIAKDYKLVGAKQLQSTESPGKMFFEEIKNWDHWAETP